MPELHPPLDPAESRSLRLAVLEHALSERRPLYRPLLHVGTPGAPHLVVPALPDPTEPAHDHAVRVDVMAALLDRASPRDAALDRVPLVWLTRCGHDSLQDVDAVWLPAALAACAEAELDLTMVVVDRHGWRDPRTGTRVRWRRLRAR